MAAKHSVVDDDVDYLFYEAVATKVQSRQAVRFVATNPLHST